MTYDELKDFTHDELGYFTCGELTLTSDEILQKIRNDNRPLPISVVEKLEELSNALPKDNLMRKSKFASFNDAFSFLNTLLTFVKTSIELKELISPYIVSVLEEISKHIH